MSESNIEKRISEIIGKAKSLYENLVPDLFSVEPTIKLRFNEGKLAIDSIKFTYWDRLVIRNNEVILLTKTEQKTLAKYNSFEEFVRL